MQPVQIKIFESKKHYIYTGDIHIFLVIIPYIIECNSYLYHIRYHKLPSDDFKCTRMGVSYKPILPLYMRLQHPSVLVI